MFFTSKSTDGIRKHKLFAHDIGIVWKYCDVEGCSSKFKNKNGVRRYKQNVHNMNPIWSKWNLCNFKTKWKNSLRVHKRRIHKNIRDIDRYEKKSADQETEKVIEYNKK